MSVEGATATVALRGEADVATVPVVKGVLDRVIADHAGPIAVDLAETCFIDSATIHILADASQDLQRRARRLTIQAPSRTAIRMLELFGLSDLIRADGGNDQRPEPYGSAQAWWRPSSGSLSLRTGSKTLGGHSPLAPSPSRTGQTASGPADAGIASRERKPHQCTSA